MKPDLLTTHERPDSLPALVLAGQRSESPAFTRGRFGVGTNSLRTGEKPTCLERTSACMVPPNVVTAEHNAPGPHNTIWYAFSLRQWASASTHGWTGSSVKTRGPLVCCRWGEQAGGLLGKDGTGAAAQKRPKHRGPDFLGLANALSAFYPRDIQGKPLLDAMLLAVQK